MIQREFDFGELYAGLRRRWPLLAVALVLGGLLGLGLSYLLPPQYRSTTSLGIGIDYGRAFPLDRSAEEKALLHVQNLVLSDDVLQAAIDGSPAAASLAEGIAGVEELRQRIRLDRYDGRWDLSVAASRPDNAAAIAAAWSQAAVEQLAVAQGHALKAQGLQSELFDPACERVPSEEASQEVWDCHEVEIPRDSALPDQILEEVAASRGIIPALTYSLLTGTTGEAQPLRPSRPWLAAAGMMIGAALGMALVLSPRPNQRP